MRDWVLALRLLRRDLSAGELWLIAAAVFIAVASTTTVGFFTDRVYRALDRQANQLLGADLVLVADRPPAEALVERAREGGLAVVRMLRFPSMVVKGDRNVLAEVKAVTPGYPLRGELRIARELYGADARADGLPRSGEAWLDERLFTQLNLQLNDRVSLGKASFVVTGIITQEPDGSIGFINSGPRILISAADLAATELVQPGSRIRYRIQFAGDSVQVEDYRHWVGGRLQPGERVEGIRDARPEIRSALERAEKFLNLAALVSVILAAGAVALAARRFLQRHLDGCAVMRCLGALPGRVVKLYLVHFAALGATASLFGCLAGFVAQSLLADWLGSLVKVDLPSPGLEPALHGFLVGFVLLVAFGAPPLLALGRVSPLRVLRRDLGVPSGSALLGYGLGIAAIAGLIWWKAADPRLAAMVLGGVAGLSLLAAVLIYVLLRLLNPLRHSGVTWRFGVGNLRRRPLGTILQTLALATGIMALLTLTVVRGHLLAEWQASLPPDAPNRFLVNIQPAQLDELRRFFSERGLKAPALYPMVRARLTAIAGRAVSPDSYTDERARRLVDREFNLSWARTMQRDNQLVAGVWWDGTETAQPQFSLEEGIAKSLGVKTGDELSFDIAGTPVSARVTSIRKVDWDSFNVNFFVVAPPGMLESHPATYVTSFHLPPGNVELLNAMIRAFPNLLLIDVAQVMTQVQRIMDQVARAVQFVFLFTLLAGLVVLYAAIASTQDERLYQAALMRTLGASRQQLTRATLAEFLLLGALAGLLAALAASLLGYGVATRILNLTYGFDAGVWFMGVAGGALGVTIAGHLVTRKVLARPPLGILRESA